MYCTFLIGEVLLLQGMYCTFLIGEVLLLQGMYCTFLIGEVLLQSQLVGPVLPGRSKKSRKNCIHVFDHSYLN